MCPIYRYKNRMNKTNNIHCMYEWKESSFAILSGFSIVSLYSFWISVNIYQETPLFPVTFLTAGELCIIQAQHVNDFLTQCVTMSNVQMASIHPMSMHIVSIENGVDLLSLCNNKTFSESFRIFSNNHTHKHKKQNKLQNNKLLCLQ